MKGIVRSRAGLAAVALDEYPGAHHLRAELEEIVGLARSTGDETVVTAVLEQLARTVGAEERR